MVVNKRTQKAAGKGSKKKQDYEEESKSALDDEEEDQGGADEEELDGGEEDDLLSKYGFRQPVELELTLPTEEKELVLDYELKFIDRNYQGKENL